MCVFNFQCTLKSTWSVGTLAMKKDFDHSYIYIYKIAVLQHNKNLWILLVTKLLGSFDS